MKRFRHAVAALAWALAACSSGPTDFSVSPEGIKSLSPAITDVSITPQVDPAQVYVEVKIKKDPYTGGAQDWNSVAADVRHLALPLFSKPAVARVRIAFKSPENKGIEWAVFFIRAADLPANWRDLTYLEFFSQLDPLPGTLETRRWLCEFYGQYSSARPAGDKLNWCKG